jgi:hypothetical protein
MIPLLSALALGTAHGAEITALPPGMRGDIGMAYEAKVVPDLLLEGDTIVGRRRAVDHTLTYSGAMGLTKVLALEVALPHVLSSRTGFSDSHRMIYDPISGTGTMLGTQTLASDPELFGKGLSGTRVSLAATPFSETAFAARGDQLTWLLRAGYQVPDKTNIWTHSNGERGAGDGASGIILETAFSTTNGVTQPYLGLSYEKRLPLRMDIVDAGGQTVAKNLQIKPASTVMVTTGLEIEVLRDEAWANGLGTALTLDPSARFGWRSGAEIPSGLFLPSVLSMTENTTVGQGATSEIWAGMGLTWRIIEYLDWNINGELGSPLAYQVEHPYDVTTGMGKLSWSAGTALTFRMRDPMFDAKVQ